MRALLMPRGASRALPILCGLWAALVLGMVVLRPGTLSGSTITTVLQFSTLLALVGLGQSLVILCGGAGIDLSVGGIASLSACLSMLAYRSGLPALLLPPLTIGIGAVLGWFNGMLVTRLRVLPLIVTLGTFYVYSGTAVALTGGAALGGVPAWLVLWGRGTLGSVPLPFLTTAMPAFAVAAVLLSLTSWGRWVYALGFNERSARLVGISVDRIRVFAYVASGGLAGVAALVSLAWLGSARPDIGQNLELTSLTAAMLGGIGIFGGRGGVLGVLAAVLLLVTLQTTLLQLNINSIWQVGIIGALLIAVLLADRFAPRRT